MSVLGNPMLSSDLCRHKAHTWYIDIHVGKTSIHIIKEKEHKQKTYLLLLTTFKIKVLY